jgi:hypothetical protein
MYGGDLIMSFYTYSKNNCYGKAITDELITWLNEHGVSCSYDTTTQKLDITDFNGMSGSFEFRMLNSNSTKYNHKITLVTDQGKELILVTDETTSATSTSNIYIAALVLNYEGTLFGSYAWCSSCSFPSSYFIGATTRNIEFNSSADNYIIPLMYNADPIKFFDNYFISVNAVEVAPGVIISDGTKQFISCGLFLFVEYDPATMSE